MKISKKFTTVTTFSKYVALSLFIFLPLSTFFLGITTQSNTDKKMHTKEVANLKVQYEQTIAEQNDEIEHLLSDTPQLKKNYKTPYSYTSFGVQSPLFDGKTVEVAEYNYKRHTIVQRQIDLGKNETDNGYTKINIWQFNDYNKESSGQNNMETIFVNYWSEFGTTPVYVMDFINDLKETYKTKNDTELLWKYILLKNAIIGVQLVHFQQYSAFNKPIFVQLEIHNITGSSKTDPQILKAKEQLMKLADTLEVSHGLF